MKLTALELHAYPGVAPGTGFTFSPSFNLMRGGSRAGGTALLELLARVLGADFSGLLREELSLEYDLAFPGMALHVSVRNARHAPATAEERAARDASALLPLRAPDTLPDLAPFAEVELRLDAPATRMVLRADASGATWEVDGRRVYAQPMRWALLERSLWVVLFMTAQALDPALKERLQPLLRRVLLLGPSRFDGALGTFERMGELRCAIEVRDGQVLPLGMMALPPWLLSQLCERAVREPTAQLLAIRHDEVARSFLARFVALAGFAAGTLRAEVLGRRDFEGGGRLELGHFDFRFSRRDDSVVSQAELREGEKRLLSFLY